MKRNFLRLMQLGIGLCAISTAYASQGYFQGTVSSVEIVGGIAMVSLISDGSSYQLNCGTSVSTFWFDPTTDLGHSYMALAITARTTGTVVNVQGNGTCTTGWP